MIALVALIGVLGVGYAWRATTVAGIGNAVMAAIVVVPMAIGVGMARGDATSAIAAMLAFAIGYGLGALPSPLPVRSPR
jgi:hypothetical protein